MTGGHLNGSGSEYWRAEAGDDFDADWDSDDEFSARGEAPPHFAYRDDDINPRTDPLPVPTVWRGEDPSKIPLRQWILGHVFSLGIVSVLVSPGGVGKSSLALTEAIQLASGRDLLGHAMPRGRMRVWVFNLEDPLEEMRRRAAAICKHHGVPYDELGDRLHLNSGLDTPMKLAVLSAKGQAQIDEEAVEHFVSQLILHRIDVVIIDPFVSSHGLPENDNSMMDRYVKVLARIAALRNIAVLLVHHTRKLAPGHEHDAESARGAKALIDGSRSVRVLNPMTKEEAIELNVREEARRRYFRASIDKQNLAPPAAEKHWYRLVSVSLENGTPPHQADADFVGVPERWAPPKPEEMVAAGDLSRVQDAIEGGEYGAAPQSADWVGNVIAKVLSMPMGDNVSRAQVKRLIAMWEASGALRREEIYSEKSRRNRPVMRVGRREEIAVAQ